jgi:very-short-patch-repair endonuclease
MEPECTVDLVRALAESQHGVVARRQLLKLDMSAERITSWVRNGRLVRLRWAIYALGDSVLTQHGRWMAAVLACGDGALLSHRSAAALWGLKPPGGPFIETTTNVSGVRARRDGLRLHRSKIVAPRFATMHEGVPVTSVAWTLLDLASVVGAPQLRRAVEAAEQRELFDLNEIHAALAAAPGRRGSRKLLALLDDLKDHGITRTRSEVEALLLQLCIDHGFPRPEVNRYDNGREVDFRWPRHHLIVEVDGWQFHRSRRAFVTDRARDRAALASGWRVARFPATEVISESGRVAAEIHALLTSTVHFGP